MAYVVANKRGTFEVRESYGTPMGPRSRTLATFAVLDQAAVRKARAKAAGDIDPERLRESALRAGAMIAPSPVDQAAEGLVRRLARGERPSPTLCRLLLDGLATDEGDDRRPSRPALLSDAARSAGSWVGASPRERGEALRDLLGLADAFPIDLRPAEIDFPRLDSSRGG